MITKLLEGLPNPSMTQQEFDAASAKLMTDLPGWGVEANALAADVNAKQAAAAVSAVAAAASEGNAVAAAASAASSGNAAAWVMGATYALNVAAISQIDFTVYRKKTASSVTTVDPKNDQVNWTSAFELGMERSLPVTDSVTLTNTSIGYHRCATGALGKAITLPSGITLMAGGPRCVVDNSAGEYPVGLIDGAGNVLGQVMNGDSVVGYLSDNSSVAGVWAFDGNLDPWWQTAEIGVTSNSGNVGIFKIDENRSLAITKNASNYNTFRYISHPAGAVTTIGNGLVVTLTTSDYTGVTLLSGDRVLVAIGSNLFFIVDFSNPASLSSSATAVAPGSITIQRMVSLDGRYVIGHGHIPGSAAAVCFDCGASGTVIAVGVVVSQSAGGLASGTVNHIAEYLVSGTVLGVFKYVNDSSSTFQIYYLSSITRTSGTTLVFGTAAGQPPNALAGAAPPTQNVSIIFQLSGANWFLPYMQNGNTYATVVITFAATCTYGAPVATGLTFNASAVDIGAWARVGAATFVTAPYGTQMRACTVAGTTIAFGAIQTTFSTGQYFQAFQAASQNDGRGIVVGNTTRWVGFAVAGNTVSLGNSNVYSTIYYPLNAATATFFMAEGATPTRSLILANTTTETTWSLASVGIDAAGQVTLGQWSRPLPAASGPAVIASQFANGRAALYVPTNMRTFHGINVAGKWRFGYGPAGIQLFNNSYSIQSNTEMLVLRNQDGRFDRNASIYRVRFAER